VLLISSEPLRARAAGIGLRYIEFARRLPDAGIAVRVASPASVEEMRGAGLEATAERELMAFDGARLDRLAAGCDAVVVQGQLANDVVLGLPTLPTAIDFYDPWLLENLHYAPSLGLDPYRNDHASWVLQLSRGDFFLCSSDEQRLYLLGLLTALGRVNPEAVAADPRLDRLVAQVPFGVPDELPAARRVLEARQPGEKRLLFGGLYDWYDPMTVLRAIEAAGRPDWRLILVRHPNPAATPQRLWTEVEAACRRSGWWGERVVAVDWVERERRFDLLREVDVLVALHRPGIETDLSFRTRFLDALVAGCPVVATEGGALSHQLRSAGAGWLVPPGDVAATVEALCEAVEPGPLRSARVAAGLALAERYRWPRALEPLVEFCRHPWRDPTKQRFAVTWPTRAPRDSFSFRVLRKLRRLAGGGA
jgi:hypothetical protein